MAAYNEKLAVGIDLGTTYCCVGGIIDGDAIAIENVYGSKTMPSCVAFTDEGRLIGNPALLQMKLNPENTICDVKRLIGRKADDSVVQKEIDRLPFKIAREQEEGVSRVKYRVEESGKVKEFTCEEISAMLLREMVRTAKNFLGSTPTHAVITIPAYYGHNERKATEDAGKIAGLNVLRIINEPTAAAIGYYGLEQITADEKILVYDLGGGTFDVSVLEHDEGDEICLTVVATEGDPHLGGRDFDEAIGNHIRQKVREKFGGIELSEQTENEIFVQSETAKRELSVQSNTRIRLDNVCGEQFTVTISRVKFDSLIKEHLDRTFEIVENTLNAAKLKQADVNKVILVGGSTKIPKVRKRMVEMFPFATVPDANHANPDEVVALGAALLAESLIEEFSSEETRDIDIFDVTSLSLGVEEIGNRMNVLLERNTSIPNEAEKTFSTTSDYQTTVEINIYEGERECVLDNNCIGTFKLSDIPARLKGEEPILVKLAIDKNGIVDVAAAVKSTGIAESLTINVKSASNLSPEEIQYMIEEAARFEKEGRVWRSKVDAKYKLIELIYKVKKRLIRQSNQTLQNLCDQFDQWLEAERKMREKEKYTVRYVELNEKFLSVFPN